MRPFCPFRQSGVTKHIGKVKGKVKKMKTYRLTIIDHNRPFNKAIISMKYYKGLSAARKASPAKLSYCRNARVFTGFDGRFEYIACEC